MLPSQNAAPEKYLIAFVIQGDDVFKISSEHIIQTPATAGGGVFDGIAKLKAAAALMELTDRHQERTAELRAMARDLVNEGMRMLARATSGAKPVSAQGASTAPEAKIA